jgi:hypothetical protein
LTSRQFYWASAKPHKVFVGDYEFVNVGFNLQLAETSWTGNDQVEITVRGFGLPKAILVRGSGGRWRVVKSFFGQCTGCLGTGQILDRPCYSRRGTGWASGLREEESVTDRIHRSQRFDPMRYKARITSSNQTRYCEETYNRDD